jgi:hypothetical protein
MEFRAAGDNVFVLAARPRGSSTNSNAVLFKRSASRSLRPAHSRCSSEWLSTTNVVLDKVPVRVASLEQAVVAQRRPGCGKGMVQSLPKYLGLWSTTLRRCVSGGMLGIRFGGE